MYFILAMALIIIVLIVTNICMVNQANAWVIERLGAYKTNLGCGSSCKNSLP